jgi:anti-sigma-K factor RskA
VLASVSGLKPAAAGKTYELWVIEPGSPPKPAGLFSAGKAVVRLTRPASPGATVAITLERAGGVAAPTTKPVLTARMSA